MLEQILTHLHNWFPVRGAAKSGAFVIRDGRMELPGLLPGQYYRIEGSVFNDGLHQSYDLLQDEAFDGTVTPLAIPKAVQAIAEEISAWCTDNPVTDKVSESFEGYSYTRAAGGSGGASGGWQAAFAARLNAWRRIA